MTERLAELLQTLNLLMALALLPRAWRYFRLWVQRRFWLPRYVHYLAAAAAGVGVVVLLLASPWHLPRRFAVLLFVGSPTLAVYVLFIGLGAAEAAWGARMLAEAEPSKERIGPDCPGQSAPSTQHPGRSAALGARDLGAQLRRQAALEADLPVSRESR